MKLLFLLSPIYYWLENDSAATEFDAIDNLYCFGCKYLNKLKICVDHRAKDDGSALLPYPTCHENTIYMILWRKL